MRLCLLLALDLVELASTIESQSNSIVSVMAMAVTLVLIAYVANYPVAVYKD